MRGFYSTIDVIKAYLEAHIQVNTVRVGNVNEVDLQKQNIYPLAQIVPGEVQFQDNTMSFSMRVIVMDSVTEFTNDPISGSNEYDHTDNKMDVYNTQLTVVNGLQNQLKQGALFSANFQLDGEPIASPFEDEYSNLLTGWVLDFNVLIPNYEASCGFQLDYNWSGSIPSDKYMEKIIYDNNQNGVVDNSERLGGELPEYYINTVPDGTVSGSGQIDHNLTTNYDINEHFTQAEISITESQISDLNHTIIPDGTISGSEQLNGTTLSEMTVSGSFSGSYVGDGSQLTGVTSYTDADTRRVLDEDGNISGSSQVVIGDTTGQLDASRIDNLPETNVPDGTVSGSSQIDHDLTLNYSASRHFLQSEISITESQISDLTHYTDSDVVSVLDGKDVVSGSYVGALPPGTVSGSSQIVLEDTVGQLTASRIDGITTDVTATSPVVSSGGNTPNISFETSGVVTGSYNFANITVDEFGRITSATNGTVSGSIDLTDVAYVNLDNHFQTDQTISGSLYVSSSSTDYSKIELYTNGQIVFKVDPDGSVSGSTYYGDGSNLTGVTSEVPAGTVSGSIQVVIGDTTGQLPASRVDGVITGSGEIDHNLTANYSSSRHFLQSEISITESQISDLTHYTDSDVKNKLNTDGVLSGSLTGDDITLENIGGAAYTSVQKMQDVYHSTGLVEGGVIVDNSSGSISVTSGEGYIRGIDSDVSTLQAMAWPSSSLLSLSDDQLNYVYIEYNAGTPQAITTTTRRTDTNTNLLIGTVFRHGTELHINAQTSFDVGDHAVKMIKRLQATAPFSKESGGVITEVGTRQLTVSEGTWWEGLKQYTTPSINTSTGDTFIYNYRDGVGGWTEVVSTTVDNLQYDDGSGTLAPLSNAKYGTHWVFLAADGTLHLVYGQDNGSLTDAQSSNVPSSLPPYFTEYARLIGKIVIGKGDVNILEIISAFSSTLSGGSGIQSLLDDTTPQLGGELDVNGFNISMTGTETVDGRDISVDGSTLDAHIADTNIHYSQSQIIISKSQISDIDGFVSSSDQVSGSFVNLDGDVMTGGLVTPTVSASYYDFDRLTNGSAPSHSEGRVWYDSERGALSVYNDNVDITLQVGQEFWIKGFNSTGGTITNGTPVHISGSQGDTALIYPAIADVYGTEHTDNHVIGIATHNILNNETGYITTQGDVNGVDTTAFSEGDILYVSSSSGELTNVIPPPPYEKMQVGFVVRSHLNGIIYVDTRQPIHFSDISGFSNDQPNDGDLWVFDSGSNIWMPKQDGLSLSGSFSGDGSNLTGLTESQITDLTHYTDSDVKNKLDVEGVVSGSSQIVIGDTTGDLSITRVDGAVSGSSQIVIGDTTGDLSITRVDGAVSSSSQIDHDQTTNYNSAEHFTQEQIFIDSVQVVDFYETHKERNDFWKVISGSATTGEVDGITFTNGIFSGDGSGLTGVITETPTGTVSGSSQVDHNLTTNYSASRHFLQSEISITESQISDLTHYTDSDVKNKLDAENVLSGSLNLDGVVSSSVQIDHNLTTNYTSSEHFEMSEISITESQISDLTHTVIPDGTISGSSQLDGETINDLNGSFSGSFSGSFFGDGSNLSGVTSYTDADTRRVLDTDNVVSGSNVARIDVDNNFTVGQTISGSLLVTGSNGELFKVEDGTGSLSVEGFVSASYYLGDGSQLSGIQTTLPGGIVSGSSQVDHDLTTNYVAGEHFLQSEISITESQISDLTHYTDADTLSYMNEVGVVSGSNVARTDVDNNFTVGQTITDSGSVVLHISGSTGDLMRIEDVVAGDVFRVNNSEGDLLLNVSSSGDVEISGSYIGDGSQLTGITTSLPSGLVSGSSQIDHDLTTNFVVNEHIDWTTSQTSSIHPDNYITGSGGVSGDYVPISGSTDITGSISIYDSGSTVFTVSGSSGELMTVTDDITYVSSSLINVYASGSEVFSMDEGGSTYTTGQYNLRTLNLAPTTASDSGTLGEIRFTSTHIYVCTASNTWKRVAIATW